MIYFGVNFILTLKAYFLKGSILNAVMFIVSDFVANYSWSICNLVFLDYDQNIPGLGTKIRTQQHESKGNV